MEQQQKQQRQNLPEVARSSLAKSKRIRQAILDKLKELKDSLKDSQRNRNVNLTARLEEIENLMKELRLASMEVIFYDFGFAHEKDVESTLWQAHVSFNGEYRQIVGRINSQNQVVLKRKVDKLYRDFLKTSQEFYRGYIQRLSSQFWIPELQQAAHGLNVEQLETPQPENAPPPALRTKLIGSCYLTLVRLGDLARYRCQGSDKPPPKASFEIALTYYGLAHMLNPDDGASYHQTAVLYQPSANHFEIIYYFLRSVCVAKPHKLGAGNLERAFKCLDNPSTSRTNSRNSNVREVSDPLLTWFLKLHAHYFQGKVFSAREELETEVLHRLHGYLKADGNEKLVLKILLINIAACDVAFDGVKDSSTWTMERSRSCQYLLSFQVRVAVVLFRLFNTVINEDVTAAVNHEQETGERTTEISASLQRLLPLARIYIAWVYVSRASLIQYQEWLEPHIRELHHLLAECLTLLLPHAVVNEEVTESKYLLSEDTEALGIRPFSERKLPLFLDVQIAPGITPPKCRKTLKPRKTALGFECSSQVEAIWRIRDILCCGIYLAGSSTSPLTTVTTNEGIDAWAYDQDRTAPARFDEKSVTRILGRLKMSAHKALTLDDELTGPKSGEEAGRASAQPEPQPTTLPPYLAGLEDQSKIPPPAQPNATAQPANDGFGLDDDFSADSEMVNMVNKLIDDEDEGPQPQHQLGRHLVDPSYGMNSTVANEIFGDLMSNPGPKAPGKTATPAVSNGKAIPSLPWNYFYSPYASSATGDGYNVPRTMGAQLGGIAGSSTVDQNSKYPSYNSLSPQIGFPQTDGNRRVSQPGQGLATSSTGAPSGPNSPNFSADQRNSALDNLKAALYAQYGPGSTGAMQSPGYAYVQPAVTKQPDAPRTGTQNHRARASASSISLEYQNSPSPSKLGKHESLSLGLMDLQLGRPQNGQAARSPVSGAGGFGKGAQLSPSITSPASNGYDFKHPGAQGLGPRASVGSSMSPFAQMPSLHASDSTLAFSNTSSLWAGTAAAADAPRGTVGCNGNFFNATTPFGRSGSINNRDDPTHFRNRLKELGAGVTESVAAYDRAILESALAEDAGKRTGRQ